MSIEKRDILSASVASALMLITCVSCSNHDAPAEVYGGNIMLSASGSNLQLAESRGGEIEALMPETIGVYGDINGMNVNVFDNQCMYYKKGKEIDKSGLSKDSWPSDNDWVYAPTKSWIADREYAFYGYAPYSNDKVDMLSTGFNERTFVFKDIPPLSATEYLVASGNVGVKSGTRPKLTMTHITSRLRFLFAIGEQYSQLRNIVVKSIKISDAGNNTPYWECRVVLSASADADQPSPGTINVATSDKIYQSTDDIELIAENLNTEGGQLLTLEYASFSSAYNLLGKIANTTLTVTYDVYDKENKLLREDQMAQNVIDLSQWTFERGKCYDVRIMVSPKYLYVLSDNDVKPDCLIDVDDPTLPTP